MTTSVQDTTTKLATAVYEALVPQVNNYTWEYRGGSNAVIHNMTKRERARYFSKFQTNNKNISVFLNEAEAKSDTTVTVSFYFGPEDGYYNPGQEHSKFQEIFAKVVMSVVDTPLNNQFYYAPRVCVVSSKLRVNIEMTLYEFDYYHTKINEYYHCIACELVHAIKQGTINKKGYAKYMK
jgi:hypothetical protein